MKKNKKSDKIQQREPSRSAGFFLNGGCYRSVGLALPTQVAGLTLGKLADRKSLTAGDYLNGRVPMERND